MSASGRLERFLALSAEITAFSVFELRGTGMAQAYLSKTDQVLGEPLVDWVLGVYDGVVTATSPQTPERTRMLRTSLFGDEKSGPIARNLIKLWYIGIWFQLPRAWTERYGVLAENTSVMVSALGFTEGLLWTAAGANPSAAKAPGYGSWADPPKLPS